MKAAQISGKNTLTEDIAMKRHIEDWLKVGALTPPRFVFSGTNIFEVIYICGQLLVRSLDMGD